MPNLSDACRFSVTSIGENDVDRMLLPKNTGNLTLFGRTAIHQGYVAMDVLEEALGGVSQAKT